MKAQEIAATCEESYCCSPISAAVRDAVPVELEIDVGGH